MSTPQMVPPVNAVGAFNAHLDQVKGRRRLNTAFGEKNKDGETSFDLPRWFTRTGKVSFEIDTGFGVMKCLLPDHKVQKQIETAEAELERLSMLDKPPVAEVAKVTKERDNLRVRMVLKMMRGLPPGWTHEGEEAVSVGPLAVAPGAALPEPSVVAAMPPEAADAYLTLLPPSVFAQVLGGYQFMAIPPLYYDEARTPSPS